MMAAYTKAELTLSPATKETRQKAIRDKEAAYQDRVQGVLERFALEKRFHDVFCSGTCALPRSATSRHFFFEIRAMPIPSS